MDQAAAAVRECFFVEVIGKTNEAHQEIVSKLKSTGHTEVSSLGESDYHLIFYSIMSEVCISKSMENISGDKPIILVVMHQASNPDEAAAPSRRQVENPNVRLTVDCLFYGDKLLQCKHNDSAWADIQKSLGVSPSQDPTPNDFNSRTAISEALENIPDSDEPSVPFLPSIKQQIDKGDKPIILVVMRRTFNPDEVVDPSRRQLDNPNVYFTVNYDFYEDKPLQCNCNAISWVDIQKSLGVSTSQGPFLDDFVNLSWKKFFVKVMGNANEGHQEIVSKLKSTGHTEVSSVEESDYHLIFYSITSEDDIGNYLKNISERTGDKPIILVVMHHSSNPNEVEASSRGQVDSLDVYLAVDCLFYGNKLLQCEHNDIAWIKIQKSLGVSSQVSNDSSILLREKFFVIVSGKTNGAHQDIVSKFKSRGQTEVSSPEESVNLLVFCPITSRVGTDISKALENIPVLREKFFVIVSGKTNGTHEDIVSKLKTSGQTEVSSPEESDYLLVFCPIASRVGTDISEALENIPELTGDKPIILVVMYYASNPDKVEAPSIGQMDNLDVLTVDCLFYGGKLLPCKHNDIVWVKIQKPLGVSSQVSVLNDRSNLLGPNFFVIVSGKTNGAHQDIVSKLKSSGQTEVSSPEESHYRLVFCPIASRVGTDISEALENIQNGKPIILVVMHHTFNPDQVVAPSRRQVDNPIVHLTVDCLFYEGKPLQCERNDIAWVDIQKCLGISPPEGYISWFWNLGSSFSTHLQWK